jgi:acetyl esterase/lipase
MLPQPAKVVDDVCILRSVHTGQLHHAPAQIFFNIGFAQPAHLLKPAFAFLHACRFEAVQEREQLRRELFATTSTRPEELTTVTACGTPRRCSNSTHRSRIGATSKEVLESTRQDQLMRNVNFIVTVLLLPVLAALSAFAQKTEKTKPAPAKKAAISLPASPAPTLADVPYGAHERHVLDFWRAESSAPTPLVFVIHGGGWVGGEKERVNRFVDVDELLKAGISVAAINYRLIKHAEAEGVEPPVKAPLHDAARALQFVRSKAAEWNIDKRRIGAAGGSAGACSSLWLAFHDDLADPNSDDPIARESTRLWCAAVTGAQTTLDPQQMKDWTPNSRYGGHAFGMGNFAQFLAAREQILPWIAEYSPYALVSAADPPVYLIYNTPPAIGQEQRDPTHTSNFGLKLRERCIAQHVACELVYPGAADVKHPTPTAYLIATLKASD